MRRIGSERSDLRRENEKETIRREGRQIAKRVKLAEGVGGERKRNASCGGGRSRGSGAGGRRGVSDGGKQMMGEEGEAGGGRSIDVGENGRRRRNGVGGKCRGEGMGKDEGVRGEEGGRNE